MPRKDDVDRFFAPEIKHRKTWLDGLSDHGRTVAFAIRRRWQSGDRDAPAATIYRRFFDEHSLPADVRLFRGFLADDGKIYKESVNAEVATEGQAKSRRRRRSNARAAG
jgi:hypothetical protein